MSNVDFIENKKMIDYNEIAKKYAAEHRCDILKPITEERNGYKYFYLNKSVRPRYLGHPHVIKISSTGKVQRVYDVEEIYWAFKLAIESLPRT